MHQLLLLAAFGTSVAHAAAVKPTGEAVVPRVVEVPLYGGLVGSDPFDYVEATVGDQKLFLRLATGHREFKLTEGAVARLGLKASGGEGKKSVKVDTIALGDAQLTRVKASVTAVGGSGPFAVDGELGLPGFQDLAFAIVPSAGVLRLAKGADGATLLSAIGTPTPAGADWQEKKIKLGTANEVVGGVPLGTPVKWSGVEVPAKLALESTSTWLAREVEGVDWYTVQKGARAPVVLPAAPGFQAGETRREWRDVTVGGVTVSTLVAREGHGIYASRQDAVVAAVGVDVLGGLDFAYDPTAGAISAKPGAGKKADYAPTYEAALRKALEVAPGEDGVAPTDEQKAAARAGGVGPLADFLEVTGRFDEAIVLRKELTTAKPDECAGWTSLGSTLVAAARPADAIEPLTRAGALYQPWAQLSLEERADIAEKKAAAEKKEQPWTGQAPQTHACHVAPGLLALAQLQAKNGAAVAMLYPAQLDLDATLPLAAGTAALLKGDFTAAQAAYLQALKLGNGNGDDARVGLYLSLAAKDFPAARGQLERLRLRYDGQTDPMLVRLYIEGIRQSQGAAGVTAALDALLAADPGDASLLAQRGRERAAAGNTAGAAQDWAAAKALFESRLASTPNDATAWANWSIALAGAGQAADAQKAAETAVKLAPGNGAAWLAMADASTASGDTAKANESRARAGMVWAKHPAYALFLAQ